MSRQHFFWLSLSPVPLCSQYISQQLSKLHVELKEKQRFTSLQRVVEEQEQRKEAENMRRFITAPYNTDHNYHKNARLQCSRFSESRGVVHCEREKRVEGVKKKGERIRSMYIKSLMWVRLHPREAKRQLEQRKQNLHGQKEELEQKTKKLQVRHDPNTKSVAMNICSGWVKMWSFGWTDPLIKE